MANYFKFSTSSYNPKPNPTEFHLGWQERNNDNESKGFLGKQIKNYSTFVRGKKHKTDLLTMAKMYQVRYNN